MSLKDLLQLPEQVKVGNHHVTVHPLTLTDLAKLSQNYYPELSEVMEGNFDKLHALVTKAPLFVATLIAYATGEPDEVETAGKIPAAAQLLILQAIWKLSMVEEESVVKFIRALAAGLEKLNASLKEDVLKRLAEAEREAQTQSPNPGT